jgi:hypothetical protein
VRPHDPIARSLPRVLLRLLPLALAGCLNLDDLRERARDSDAGSGDDCELAGDCGCEGGPEDLRLWKLHIGQSDYVTIKNVGNCRVELGGLHLFVDDHSDLFPDFEIDCLVRLPARTLLSGGEVRVHEHGVEGDIPAMDHVVSGCGAGVSPNPERGAAIYLCDGTCEQQRVLDVVVYTGEMLDPPDLRFRQSFDAPLQGVRIATQESAHFVRAAIAGRPPTFFGSDWALETRYLHATFDVGVELELDGQIRGWEAEPGEAATVSTTSENTIGAAALRLSHRGSDGRSDGVGVALTGDQGRPRYLSYFTRMKALPASGGYVDLRAGDFSAIRAGFEGHTLGTVSENDVRTGDRADAGVFYQVELRNIDWDGHTYDLYIDRLLIERRVRFWSSANAAERLSLYDASTGSTADYDEIEAWR